MKNHFLNKSMQHHVLASCLSILSWHLVLASCKTFWLLSCGPYHIQLILQQLTSLFELTTTIAMANTTSSKYQTASGTSQRRRILSRPVRRKSRQHASRAFPERIHETITTFPRTKVLSDMSFASGLEATRWFSNVH